MHKDKFTTAKMRSSAEYKENYTSIDWSKHNKPVKADSRARGSRLKGVLGDIEEFVSPLDGTVISSRSQLRAYEREKGVKQCGNDYTSSEKPTWWDNRHE